MTAREKGFTLLELLIGMSLTAAVLATLVIGLDVATRAWQHGEARLQKAHREWERADFMARQISSLVPYRVVSRHPQLPGQFTVLEAGPVRLRFLATYSSRFRNRAGRVLVEYAVVETSRGRMTLALRETPVGDDEALLRLLVQEVDRSPETGQPVIAYRPFSLAETDIRLMDELASAQFDYLDPRPGKHAPGWLPGWEPKPEREYPAAIRFRWQRDAVSGEETIPVPARFVAE